jgi:hypothetical protein
MKIDKGFSRWIHTFALVVSLLLIPKCTTAGVVISIQAQGTVDLQNLVVGQVFSVDVILSGLQPAEELNYLAASITFDSTLLGDATYVVAGSIVPDLHGFAGFGTSGLADGNYDVLSSLSGARISSIGTLYSFSITAQQVGSDFIDIDLFSLAARDRNDLVVTVDSGAALHYRISGGAVPEPASWLVFSAIGLAIMQSRRRGHS